MNRLITFTLACGKHGFLVCITQRESPVLFRSLGMANNAPSIETSCQLLIDYLRRYKIIEQRGNPSIFEMWNALADIPSDQHEVVIDRLVRDGCIRRTKQTMILLPRGSEWSTKQEYVHHELAETFEQVRVESSPHPPISKLNREKIIQFCFGAITIIIAIATCSRTN